MFVALMLIAVQGFAGGRIAGKVTDGKTGEAVIGATIVVKGTTAGTTTDVDGNFIVNTEAGTHTIEVKYIGYQGKEVDEVVVKENEVATVNITLTEVKSTRLQEVVVRSSAKKENISALYTIQKNAASVSDGISADVIKRSPDRSTGEVLKRVSGTTIQDNKFVIVRGLSDRYNVALVDNAILPSTEPNKKAFSFDIIPASLIDNIVITKSATPDLPGDFAGGVINILTKEIPEQNFNSVAIGASYNSVATGKDFKSGYRTGTDILGFDNGDRQLPSSFPTADQVQKGLSTQQSIPYLQTLNNDFGIRTHKALPGFNFQGSLGRTYSMKGNGRLGVTAALTYSHTETVKKDLIRQYDNFDYKDQAYIYSSNLGALVNVGYSFKKSKIVFKNLYNRTFDDQFLYREGINYGNTADVRYYAYDLIQKSLFKSSLEGDHQLGKGKLGWLLSYNIITNNQPDQRKVSYGRNLGTNNPFAADNTTLGRANNRLFGDLNENIYNGGLNYSMPFKFLDKSSFKVGVFSQYRTREFKNRYIGAVLDQSYPDAQNIRTRPVDQLYTPDLITNGAYYLNDLTAPGDRYDATAITNAAYGMLDNKITENFRVVWGVRFESYDLNLKAGATSTTRQEIDRTWNDVLPSANFTYSLNDKSNLRASYFRSVARPELREVAGDLFYYDYELNANFTGNYALERSRIHNADIRYELFPGAGEIFSVSAFYKYFDKTLENQVYAAGSSYEIKPYNYKSATNIGVELEVRKNLAFIAQNSFLKNMNFYVNLAYINSKVGLEGQDRFVNGHEIDSRPLSGQSPYVVNTSLGYSALKGKLNFNVLYNRIGQRIFLVGQGRLGNVYEMPRNLMDFQASWNVSDKSEFRVNVKDIFNAPVKFYFDQDANDKFGGVNFENGVINSGEDWILQRYRTGTTFSLTYSYRF